MPIRHPPTILTKAVNALFPGRCIHCQLPSHRAIDLCPGCESELISLNGCCPICSEPLPNLATCGACLVSPPAFSQIISPYLYKPPLADWINRFKHAGDLQAGRVLGHLLARFLSSQTVTSERPDFLLPVPLHYRRRFTRGFNQAHEIARIVGQQTNLRLHSQLLRRARYTGNQQSLNRRDRLRNLQGAFIASADCTGLRIAVVDDVVTTTGTARALSSALLSKGARSVEIWAIARAGKISQ